MAPLEPGEDTPEDRDRSLPRLRGIGPAGLALPVVVLVLPLLVVQGLWRPFDLPKLLVAVLAALLLPLAAAPHLRARWRATPVAARVLAGAVVSLAGWALVRAVTSDVPVVSLLGTQLRFVGALTVVAAAALVLVVPGLVRDRDDLHRVVLALALMVAVVSVHAVVQASGLSQMPWRPVRYGKPVGTFGNPNMLGAVIALGAPVGLYLWRATPRLLIGIPAFLVFLGGVFFLASSALGFLAATAGVVVYLALERAPAGWVRPRRWLLVLSPALGHAGAYVAVYLGHLVGLGSSTARVHLHAMATPLIAQAPVTGIGWGRFEAYHEATRPIEAVTLGSRSQVFADSSHDLLLDVAASTGLVGLALLLATVAAAGAVLLAAADRFAAAGRDPAPVHLIAAWLAVSGAGLSLTVPVVAMVWLWMLGLGLAVALTTLDLEVTSAPVDATVGASGTTTGRRRSPGTGTVVRGILAAGATVAVLVAARPLLAAAWAVETADQTWLDEAWADSAAAGERATARAPWWPRTWAVLGRARQDAGELDAAAAAYEAALDRDPRQRAALRALPVVEGLRGRDQAAEEGFARAIANDPRGFELRLDQAEWALDTGQLEVAAAALDHADGFLTDGMDDWDRFVELRDRLDDARGDATDVAG